MSREKKSRASIHDVAREAGVSAATVSKVLRGVDSVKAANVERVRSAVDKFNYRMDPLASGLRRSKRQILGLILPELESEFFGRLASRIELMAEAAGYSLSIATSQEDEDRERALVARMSDWRVAGTILAPVRSEKGKGTLCLKENGMTAVIIDRVSSDDVFDSVSVNNAAASAKVTRHLIQTGHRDILLLGLHEVSKNIRTRISAAKKQVKKHDTDTTIHTLMTDGTLEDLRSALTSYLDNHSPDAIYSLFQRGTLAALSEIRRRGMICPDDISLVGFDDAEWMQATHPDIAAMAQPVDDIAQHAFELLMRRLHNPTGAPVSQLLECSFMPRSSIRVRTVVPPEAQHAVPFGV